jgi:hypothetical protein
MPVLYSLYGTMQKGTLAPELRLSSVSVCLLCDFVRPSSSNKQTMLDDPSPPSSQIMSGRVSDLVRALKNKMKVYQ